MRKWMNIIEGSHTPNPNDQDDDEHWEALDQTGFFGAQGAGCLPMCRTTGRIMIVLRSNQVEQPGTWGCVGGAHKSSEQPVAAARRELHEETGFNGVAQMVPLLVFQSGTFTYRNFLGLVDSEFVPDLGWEADDYAWITLEQIGKTDRLHFGLEALFNDAASMEVLQSHEKLSGE
jgi:8-oxo-dGTP pyrophosphatase MutT (NUDIX family)